MVNDWTFAVEVYNENRKLLSVDIIEQRLRSVVQDATRRIQAGEEVVPVGILSADHRDRWTEVRFVHPIGPMRRLTLSRISNISSLSPPLIRRPSKSSSSRSSLLALTPTPSVFAHMVIHTPHAPRRRSTRPRKSTATCTTFVPRSMPETGGSIRVTPSSSRRTPAPGQWVNIHLATPSCPALLPITPPHSPSFPSRSRRRNPLRFFPSVISIVQGGRDWTGSRMHVSRRNVSLLSLAPKASYPTRTTAFSGSQTMAQTGSSPLVHLGSTAPCQMLT